MGTSGERRTIENISNNVEKRIQRAFPEQKFVLREDKNRFIIESPANVGNPSGRFLARMNKQLILDLLTYHFSEEQCVSELSTILCEQIYCELHSCNLDDDARKSVSEKLSENRKNK